MKTFRPVIAVMVCLFVSCTSRGNAVDSQAADSSSGSPVLTSSPAQIDVRLQLPPSFPPEISSRIIENQKIFLSELMSLLESDPGGLLVLADKGHALDSGYEPSDLVSLVAGRSYTINRNDMKLRIPAEKALAEMAQAARADGITLLVSSAYRSYAYQKTVYERNVRELGQSAADRESARPGTSQHQLGTAVDFGSITDDYAQTKAGKWLAANAGTYGWSLSFPDGYESVTGYRWECWHYRYLGREVVALQNKWFDGVQQYMMEFIDAWQKARQP